MITLSHRPRAHRTSGNTAWERCLGTVSFSKSGWLQLTLHRYLLEHGLLPDGTVANAGANTGNPDVFFSEARGGEKFVPRSIFVDLDPSPIDEIRTGPLKKLFHPELLLSGKEDAANNYARGHYTVGKDLIDEVLDKVRRVAGVCFMLSTLEDF